MWRERRRNWLFNWDRANYTYVLDEQLKIEKFLQFLHQSLRTDEFIDIDKNEKCNIQLTKKAINKEEEVVE